MTLGSERLLAVSRKTNKPLKDENYAVGSGGPISERSSRNVLSHCTITGVPEVYPGTVWFPPLAYEFQDLKAARLY